MPHPIRGFSSSYMLRPGWSEFGGWRAGGAHQGFDYYCPINTPIYGTSNGGTVAGKGGPTGAPGWQVTIRYANYTTRNVHMNGPSPLAIGAKVSTNTIIGYVGATGNAANIAWNNKRHLHHEVYPDGYSDPVDPLWYYGAIPDPGLAGGNVTPITPEIEDDMYEQADRERDSRIEQLLADTKKSVDNTHAGIWRGGSVSIDGVAQTFRYGVLPVVTHNQTLIVALTEAVKALSIGQGADPEAIRQAAYEGAGRALDEFEVAMAPTAQENALAVEQQLADNFALIPQAVNLDLKNRL